MEFQFGKNLKSGLFWIGLFKALGQGFIWANTIIIARFLNPSDYGLVGMAALLTEFAELIGDFGFGTSLVQKKDLEQVHVHSLFCLVTGLGLIVMLGLYMIAPWAALFLKTVEVIPILQLSAVALFFRLISDIPMKLLLKRLEYKKTGLTEFVSSLIQSLSVLTLALFGFGAYSLVLGSILGGILKFGLACWLGRWFPRARFEKNGLGGFLRFGGAVVLTRILWYAYSNADYMVLAKRLGVVTFGLYSFAFNFACIPINKLQPILHPVLFSSFSKMQDDLPGLRSNYLQVIKFAFTVYAMLYCGIFWVAPEFVTLILGAKWEPIIPVLCILLLIQPLRAISSLSSSLMDSLGKPGIMAKNMLILVLMMIPSFVIGSFWGMIGVSLAWWLVFPLAFLFTSQRILKVAGISLKSYLAQLQSGVRFIVITSAAIGLYKFVLWYFYPIHDTIFLWISFGGTVLVGTLSNMAILWWLERPYVAMLRSLLKR